MEFIEIKAAERAERGTAANRRLRRAGHVPGVIYGLHRESLPVAIPGEELTRFLRTGSHLVALRVGAEVRDAILREVQQDPVSDCILHVDFQGVDKDALLDDEVGVVFKGTPAGTREGGVFQGMTSKIAVRARPRDLPEEIVVEVSHLKVGDAIHLRDLVLPPGVTLLDSPDGLVAHVVVPKVVEAAVPAPAEGVTAAEPEVIGRVAAPAEGEEAAEG